MVYFEGTSQGVPMPKEKMYGLRLQICHSREKLTRKNSQTGGHILSQVTWKTHSETPSRLLWLESCLLIDNRHENLWHRFYGMKKKDWLKERWPIECGVCCWPGNVWKCAPFRPRATLLPGASILSSCDNSPSRPMACVSRLKGQWACIECSDTSV